MTSGEVRPKLALMSSSHGAGRPVTVHFGRGQPGHRRIFTRCAGVTPPPWRGLGSRDVCGWNATLTLRAVDGGLGGGR